LVAEDDHEPGRYTVSAIIDWELSGFLPWWAQSFSCCVPGEMIDIMGEDWRHPERPGQAERVEEIQDLIGPIMDLWMHRWQMFRHSPGEANIWD